SARRLEFQVVMDQILVAVRLTAVRPRMAVVAVVAALVPQSDFDHPADYQPCRFVVVNPRRTQFVSCGDDPDTVEVEQQPGLVLLKIAVGEIAVALTGRRDVQRGTERTVRAELAVVVEVVRDANPTQLSPPIPGVACHSSLRQSGCQMRVAGSGTCELSVPHSSPGCHQVSVA